MAVWFCWIILYWLWIILYSGPSFCFILIIFDPTSISYIRMSSKQVNFLLPCIFIDWLINFIPNSLLLIASLLLLSLLSTTHSLSSHLCHPSREPWPKSRIPPPSLQLLFVFPVISFKNPLACRYCCLVLCAVGHCWLLYFLLISF